MSGGVDSSAAAALLVEQGHEVIGLTMRLYNAKDQPRKGRGGTCCSPAEVDLAQRACEILQIPHYTVDEQARFQDRVIDDFAREYAAGRTPNPCARCNEHVKFGPLLTRARAFGAAFMATGHYARIEDGGLWRGTDPSKDQSYFLFAMGRATLEEVRFPLGGWTKDDVRDYARSKGMPNWDAPDSQELCFVPDGDHARVVERRAEALGLDPETLAGGEVVDTDNNPLGTHGGIHRVTVGQRRGLGLSSTKPRYVLKVLPERRQVMVGDASQLARTRLEVSDFRPMMEVAEGEPMACAVQIRHRSPATAARLVVRGARAQVTFESPVRAVAPGQAAVAYVGDRVVGGGWIEGAE